MQRNYLTIKQFLESEFPSLQDNISGGNHPPPPFAVLMMKALSYIHLLAIALAFMGDKIWSYIPFVKSPPGWYVTAKQYPMQSFVLLFFIVPTFLQSFVTTGAFEIMLDGKILFSKIQTGRFPDGPELIEIFENAGLAH
jgi:selT/selW/selH-like putative selenoprotein